MKRVCGLFLFLAIVLLVPVDSQGATLQAGWYACVKDISIDVYGPFGTPVGYGAGWLYTSPGEYGPFVVTDDPFHSRYSRTVTVLNSATGVAAGTAVELPIYNTSSISQIARLSVWWETNYDVSQMRLELAQRNSVTGAVTTIWQQNQSGYSTHADYIGYDLQPQGLFFRVVAVPEPSPLMLLGGAFSLVAIVRQRRRVV